MPYSGASDPSLPSNVKKLSTAKKKKWVATFNSVLGTEGKTESDAFAIANGTIKKDYVPSVYDVDARQLMPEQVNYNPLGMTSERGCGGCNWYVPPSACVCVFADIMPTGVCDLFMAPPVYEAQPIPVTIVKEGDSLPFMARMAQAIKNWATGNKDKEVSSQISIEENAAPPDAQAADAAGVAPVPANTVLRFYKDGERLRFFVVYSNCFKDKQDEIITVAAHKDFTQWVTETGKYPDLWLWHSGPSSKWGKTDFVDFVDGFAVASGLIDEGKEYIAEALSKQNIGVSHGFKGLINNGSILRYRTFEISPLPIENSANNWTAFSSEEMTMPFSDKKKEWLKSVAGLTDEAIKEWEGNLTKLSDQLKGMGLEWKDAEPDDVTGQIVALTKAITDVTAVVGTVVEKVKTLSTDMDTKVASVFQAEVAKLPQGFQASQSKDNVVDDKTSQKNMEWFGNIISQAVK